MSRGSIIQTQPCVTKKLSKLSERDSKTCRKGLRAIKPGSLGTAKTYLAQQRINKNADLQSALVCSLYTQAYACQYNSCLVWIQCLLQQASNCKIILMSKALCCCCHQAFKKQVWHIMISILCYLLNLFTEPTQTHSSYLSESGRYFISTVFKLDKEFNSNIKIKFKTTLIRYQKLHS